MVYEVEVCAIVTALKMSNNGSCSNIHMCSLDCRLQLCNDFMECVGVLLQIKVLLSPIMNFLEQGSGDASYAVAVVALILNCVQLSSRPGTTSSIIYNSYFSLSYLKFCL